jgi:hypothetical protein
MSCLQPVAQAKINPQTPDHRKRSTITFIRFLAVVFIAIPRVAPSIL